jgi:tRNA (guanine37-N1)-methyltransferase
VAKRADDGKSPEDGALSVRDIAVITVHPQVVEAYARCGILRAAEAGGIAHVRAIDLRAFAVDKHATVDDRPYGGGDGMVLRPEPLAAAIEALPAKPRVLLATPSGKPWSQAEAARWADAEEPLAFVCGRFAGVDQRFIDQCVDAEYSLGDFIVSGGELPSLMMIDAILRLVPGVLGHPDSARLDSFGADLGFGLEHPLYTRPPEWRGDAVPEVLMSGDHKRIAAWRDAQARERTAKHRPDLLRNPQASKA